MPAYDLPKSLEVGGAEYAIRSDYRAVLDIMEIMADPDLEEGERSALSLFVFYPDFDRIPTDDLQEAVDRMLWFVGGGEEDGTGGRKARVMDWSQDFPLIAAPVNRVLGYEVRACEYLHWWSFLSAYYEIGDCLFAQVVSIRRKQREGKKLDQAERKFYRENRGMVDLRKRESEADAEVFAEWIG